MASNEASRLHDASVMVFTECTNKKIHKQCVNELLKTTQLPLSEGFLF
jgi:hypothetical protein